MSTVKIRNFDALKWIDAYYSGRSNIVPQDFQPVYHFALIWNLFESVTCGKNATPISIRNSVYGTNVDGHLDLGKYKYYVEYFKKRYSRFGSFQQVVKRLRLFQEHRMVVMELLSEEPSNTNQTVYGLLLIVHRIRNNFFHGTKEVDDLHNQTELFHVANNLLADYIDDYVPPFRR
jgi:hypothetical protein